MLAIDDGIPFFKTEPESIRPEETENAERVPLFGMSRWFKRRRCRLRRSRNSKSAADGIFHRLLFQPHGLFFAAIPILLDHALRLIRMTDVIERNPSHERTHVQVPIIEGTSQRISLHAH